MKARSTLDLCSPQPRDQRIKGPDIRNWHPRGHGRRLGPGLRARHLHPARDVADGLNRLAIARGQHFCRDPLPSILRYHLALRRRQAGLPHRLSLAFVLCVVNIHFLPNTHITLPFD